MKISILHFQPLEGYPPIMNLLNCFAYRQNLQIACHTTRGFFWESYNNEKIQIYRHGNIWKKGLKKWGSYFRFNVFSLIHLILYKPESIIYFESISSFPVYLYKRYINKNAQISIHYHEYTSIQEYVNGMKLVKYFHQKEKWLYNDVMWISHTNDLRMKKFIQDEGLADIEKDKLHIMPNFPSEEWKLKNQKKNQSYPLSIIYVGYTLSFDTMYTGEFFKYVSSMGGKLKLDCFLHKSCHEIKAYIERNKIKNVDIKESVSYFDLPKVLTQYDIGVILYKGKSDNYIYNAPNKLFEYLACGLNVWFPKEMIGIYPYITINSYPKVIKIDFKALYDLKLDQLISTKNIINNTKIHYCEDVYSSFAEELLKNCREK